LITGATGFLGRHVLDALAGQGPDRPIYALMRNAGDWAALDYAHAHPRVVPIEGDLVGSDAWLSDPRLASLGGVIHLAALVKHSRRDPEPLMRANIDGTLRMVDLAGRAGAPMVFVSTSGTVGCSLKPARPVDEDAPYIDGTVAGWPYYASKIRAEREGRRLAAEMGVPLTVLRPPVLLGPGDHRYRSTSNIIKMLRRKLPFVIDGGISFCDVRDVARATVAALGHPAHRPVYHLPGHDLTIGGFFELCAEVSGVPAPKRYLPYSTARLLAGWLEAGAHALGKHSPLSDPVVVEMARHHWGITSRHAEGELGYRLRDGRETLTDTITWLRANHPDLGGPAAAADARVAVGAGPGTH
jgi:nucleoside-diphosphate-sugar epimerase